ncbi:MAG: addiction module protein [Planctomycetes bacterium]|nr:addiction module protein [Planctomycetota bacterium]
MNATVTTLLESILALPERDRLMILDAILESMPEDSSQVDDEEFSQELTRRSEEAKADPNAGIPWSEVKKMR